MAFENYVVTGFKRRQKNINEVENKSQRLRNERKIAESKKFENLSDFLLSTQDQQNYQPILVIVLSTGKDFW